MVVGSLEIEILASIAKLQADMTRAQRVVSDTVNKMNAVLQTIGVGVSLSGIASLIKGVVDTGDKLNDLSKITGLTVAQLGGLGKAAKLNGTELETVTKAIGAMSKNMFAGADAFGLLQIATKDASGQLRDANSVFLDVADRFSRMEDGAAKAALAQQIFGKSGRELIPLLNEGRASIEGNIDSFAKYSGMTQQMAQESDQFNDTLEALIGKWTALKTAFVGDILPALNNIGTAMLEAQGSTNKFSFATQVVVPFLKDLATTAFAVVSNFRIMGNEISARADQLKALVNLDFKGAGLIGDDLAKENAKVKAEYSKFVDTVQNGSKQLEVSNEVIKKAIQIDANFADKKKLATAAVDKQRSAIESFLSSLRKETESIGKNATELKRMEAARLGILSTANPLIDKLERETRAIDLQNQKTNQIINDLEEYKRLTDGVMTSQEKFNRTVEGLNRMKNLTNGAAISQETYNRALSQAQKELTGVTTATRSTTTEVDQLWTQAGRNIQSSLSNSIFNFFDDGLKGMVRNVGIAVARIASEFAALRLAQGIGLDRMFSVNASGGKSGSSLMDMASIGSNALSMLRTGGRGITGLFGGMGGSAGVFSNAGGAGTAFIGGPGTAIGGSGLGGAATLASTLGGASAVAAAYALSIKVGSMIAKDFKIGGMGGGTTSMIGAALGGPFGAIVAGAINRIFGREEYKFRQESIQGTVSQGGFDGTRTTVMRSKGGLFMSNKHKSFDTELPREVTDAFDTAIGAFYKSAHGFAENLGLDVKLVDGFSKEIKIVSEKKEKITAEAITAMIEGFGASLAENLLPTIDAFKKAGETSFQVLQRLSSEFAALENAATLLGHSVRDSRGFLLGSTTFEGRSDFIEAAGGMDKLASSAQFFADNFLTAAEQLAPVQERLNTELTKLGLSSDLTKDQFKDLVQSFGSVNGISEDMLISLLDLAPAFITVRDAANEATEAIAPLVVGIEDILSAAILLGHDAKAAAEFLNNQTTSDQRGAFLNAVGGPDALLGFAQFFDQNFVPEAKKVADATQLVQKTLSDLNLPLDLTNEQFYELIHSLGTTGGISLDTAKTLAGVADELLVVNAAAEQWAQNGLSAVDDVFARLQESVEAERKAITDKYNTALAEVNLRIQDITGSIGKLQSFSASLKDTIDRLKPLGREAAKDLINSAISSGSFNADSLKPAIDALTSQSTAGFKSSFEFAREQAKASAILGNLKTGVDAQLTGEQKLLVEMQQEKLVLDEGFRNEMERLDSILDRAKDQITAINGVNSSVIDVKAALANFNLMLKQNGGKAVKDPLTGNAPIAVGNTSISNNDIYQYFSTQRSADEIYRDSKKFGVTSEQIIASGRFTKQQADEFFTKNPGIPRFAMGGYHRGGLRIVGERGPELERTNPSQITSNANLKESLGTDELLAEMRKMVKILDSVTSKGTSIRTTAAA